MDGLTAAGPRHSVQICKKPDRKRPSARQLLDLTPSLSVPRQERVELVLIDARFVVSGCLEALQICRTARASSSTSHLTVQEPPAAPYRDGAVLVCKRCASDSSFRCMFINCCPTRIACRPTQRRHGQHQLGLVRASECCWKRAPSCRSGALPGIR